MQYRRDYTNGASYFFTLVTFQRKPLFEQAERVAELRSAFADEMRRRPFYIDAIVIMPDHIHTIWTLPATDSDYSIRWRNIKRTFTLAIPKKQRPKLIASRHRKQEQAIWQRRFWEHRLRDEKDFNQHVDYIHYNPVKHGKVSQPADWQYSSIHRYMRDGIIGPAWGCSPIKLHESVGRE